MLNLDIASLSSVTGGAGEVRPFPQHRQEDLEWVKQEAQQKQAQCNSLKLGTPEQCAEGARNYLFSRSR